MGERRRRRAAAGMALTALALVSGPGIGRGQDRLVTIGGEGYDGRYGEPVWVGLEVLLKEEVPMEFRNKAIHTRGIFHVNPSTRRADAYGAPSPGTSPRRAARYMLATSRDAEFQGGLSIQPVPELADAFESEATDAREREMDVVGVLGTLEGTGPAAPSPARGPAASGAEGTAFTFWKYWSEDAGRPKRKGGPIVSMEQVVGKIDRFGGTLVRFRGQFRGRDLFGEAACAGSPSGGWVVKDGPFAVWVTGQKPQGSGWNLDVARRDDTERWLEIVGRPELKGDCIVVRAEEVYPVTGP